MKLTLEQRIYLDSLDSKNKRKKQKKEFKLQNLLFGNDVDETLESLYSKMNDIKEDTKHFIVLGDGRKLPESDYVNHIKSRETDSTLTKDMLKDLTQPKVRTYSIDDMLH